MTCVSCGMCELCHVWIVPYLNTVLNYTYISAQWPSYVCCVYMSYALFELYYHMHGRCVCVSACEFACVCGCMGDCLWSVKHACGRSCAVVDVVIDQVLYLLHRVFQKWHALFYNYQNVLILFRWLRDTKQKYLSPICIANKTVRYHISFWNTTRGWYLR